MFSVTINNYRHRNRIPDEPTDHEVFVDKDAAQRYYDAQVVHQKSNCEDFWIVQLDEISDLGSVCLSIESNEQEVGQ